MTRPGRARLLLLCLLVGLALGGGAAAVEEGDITAQCRIRMNGVSPRKNQALDRKYHTAWNMHGTRKRVIEISLPEGVRQGGLYLCFAVEPARLEVFQGDHPHPIAFQEGESFAHRYIPFEGDGILRVELRGSGKGVHLSELFVLAGKEPPAWVQRWQPPLERVDLLVLVAHPDDELLWFGGAIPYYALERGKRVAVATMTCASAVRRSEALNALWTAGLRHYPMLGAFRDRRMPSLKQSYRLWGGEDKVVGHVTNLLRRLQPQVVLTHDLAGEYGHPAHVITARALVKALDAAASGRRYPDSARQYGTWNVPKAYLHLYPEGAIRMDWQQPIAAHGGLTALEVSHLAFQQYRSQQRNWALSMDGPHSPARFGLYRSLVGEDARRDDFFEHIP